MSEQDADSQLLVPDLDEKIYPQGNRQFRTEAERARDLEEISQLYLRGRSKQEIADELVRRHHYERMSVEMIKVELQTLRKMWVQSALINYDEAKAREIAHIDELESAAWDAWNKSWGKDVIKTQEGIEDRWGSPKENPVKSEEEEEKESKRTYYRKRGLETTKERFGDPRYLDQIKWCIEQRCKILGLHEPLRMAITWQEEATKFGIKSEDAQAMYKQMVSVTTKALRDQYLKDQEIDISQVLEGEFEDATSGELPDGYE